MIVDLFPGALYTYKKFFWLEALFDKLCIKV